MKGPLAWKGLRLIMHQAEPEWIREMRQEPQGSQGLTNIPKTALSSHTLPDTPLQGDSSLLLPPPLYLAKTVAKAS